MCTTGIKDQVKEYTSDKPYLKFNSNDFITVKLGGEINTNNIFEVAKSHANTLNRAINNGKTIGKVFYAESGSDVTGIGIRPTMQQLNHLNANTENEIDQTRKELEEQLAIESVKERETDLGIDEFGDSDPFFNEDDNIPKVYQKRETLQVEGLPTIDLTC